MVGPAGASEDGAGAGAADEGAGAAEEAGAEDVPPQAASTSTSASAIENAKYFFMKFPPIQLALCAVDIFDKKISTAISVFSIAQGNSIGKFFGLNHEYYE
ncbi:hypothetical protein SDC9_171931 [bioreactor metagenome]|uniref:Uncharacterized protein n=1 Tax=bioreactor metagenome TaxID=1076179 RepID=A0A645GET6_9ZZZZ